MKENNKIKLTQAGGKQNADTGDLFPKGNVSFHFNILSFIKAGTSKMRNNLNEADRQQQVKPERRRPGVGLMVKNGNKSGKVQPSVPLGRQTTSGQSAQHHPPARCCHFLLTQTHASCLRSGASEFCSLLPQCPGAGLVSVLGHKPKSFLTVFTFCYRSRINLLHIYLIYIYVT